MKKKRKSLCSEGITKKKQHKMQQFFSGKRIQYHEEALKDSLEKKKCIKNQLTLRAVLHWAGCVAGGAEFVHRAGDVFHLRLDHCLHIVNVEQVEALQTTMQGRDLAPGVAQADRHPV